MATLNNYGELKAAIEEWMMASSEVSPQADLCIRLSQPYINMKLRAREMIAVDQIIVDSGQITVPDGFLAQRRVVYLDGDRRIPLKPLTMEKSDALYPYRPSGTPAHYAIIGNKIRLFPVPENGNVVELTYYTGLTAFSEDEDADWLLAKYPNLYLAAGQMYAAEFIKEDEEAQKQAAILDTFISMLNALDEQSEFGDAEFQPEEGVPV